MISAAVIAVLARDEELSVCGPVLRYSPVLTDDDLLQIIRDAGFVPARRDSHYNVLEQYPVAPGEGDA